MARKDSPKLLVSLVWDGHQFGFGLLQRANQINLMSNYVGSHWSGKSRNTGGE